MSYCNTFCAKSVKGETVTFSIKDIPIKITTETFVLLSRPISPILLLNSIVTVSDIYGVYEGSSIRGNDGINYIISYKRGFAAMNEQHRVFKLHQLNGFKVLNVKDDVPVTCKMRIMFKAKDILFQISDIVDGDASTIVVKNGYSRICTDNIQQYAGITYNSKKLFFGDHIDLGIVQLNYGRVCAYNNGKYIDVTDLKEVPKCLL